MAKFHTSLFLFTSTLFIIIGCIRTLSYHQEDPSLSDWLVNTVNSKTSIKEIRANLFRLDNGLIYRDFLIQPNFATIDFFSKEVDSSLLRAFAPEAQLSLEVDNKNISIPVGGLDTDTPRGYLNRTDLKLRPYSGPIFKYSSHTVENITSDIHYVPKRGAPSSIKWPPPGLHLGVKMTFDGNDLKIREHVGDLEVIVHYEMFDNIPLISKWLELRNIGETEIQGIQIDFIEKLQVNSEWSGIDLAFPWTGGPHVVGRGWLHVETELPHGAEIVWEKESDMNTVYGGKQPYMQALNNPIVKYSFQPGEYISSFKVYELVVPTDSRERRGLARRRMMRLLAPWTLENPIFFHMTNSSSAAVRKVLHQMKQVGFEMMIYSFGSGFDLESVDKKYLDTLKADIAYANSLGIEVGGYDLIALSRRVKSEWLAINGQTNSSYPSACFASGWYNHLLNTTLEFIDYTGLTMVETDGPYGGYTCSSDSHEHHEGEGDSVYHQNRLQGMFFKQLRNRGLYINQPDTYYLQGGNKGGMGYNKQQFSLPRWEDLSISRQTVYDNTFNKPPSMGWMFMPLVEYEGGGAAAIFEPLSRNLAEYSWGLAQYLGAGVAACYRGPRLYDSVQTKVQVSRWVTFYKSHREVLGGDIIHVKRPNMQDIDAWIHVNAEGKEKGLLMIFNPTNSRIEKHLSVPLYYTGLIKTTSMEDEAGNISTHILCRDYTVVLNISMDPLSLTYYIFK